MSEQPDSPGVPQWDTADRMRKALRVAGIGPGEMAAYLDVGGNTVSTWINGRINPSKQTLRLWAMRCGVDFNWLCHGDSTPCGPGTGKTVSPGQKGGMMTMSSSPLSPVFGRKWTPETAEPLAYPVAA